MASAIKFRYQRLKDEGMRDEYEGNERLIVRSRNWFKFRRVHSRRRFRLKVPSLKRFLKRKVRLVRVSCAAVLKRLKEGKGHIGDLFTGNYMFLQVNPTSFKCFDKYHHGRNHNLNGLPPRYYIHGV
ncbi:hypothetical protein K2173_021060 [Erythroxylum novogranatense]|uniref:Uncharacterized protein n=1 Tax=Erythroxylum novogranatense TaxID=1862640 RepID=A0AAV8TQ47_9ROSI|nr:hypothetical protein K2173_021060 [Erythroxylum novogranatense]